MNIYETHLMEDPRLPFIFHVSQNQNKKRVHGGNWHENIEILLFTEGEGIVGCDTRQIHVSAGDIVVVNPNRFHTMTATSPTLINHCLIVDRSFCIANCFDTNTLRFDEHFIDMDIGELMCKLAEEYTLAEIPQQSIPLVRAYVLHIMALLCCRHTVPASEDKHETHLLGCVKQAIGLIRSDSHRDLSLDEISDFVGLSKYYFAREFKRVTGYTLVSYINLTRCEKAKLLLAEGKLTIGEIGRQCGFSSQSYFTKTFRIYTGTIPDTYRKSHIIT